MQAKLEELVPRILRGKVRDDAIESCTLGNVRKEAEERLGLPSGALDEHRLALNQIILSWLEAEIRDGEEEPRSARKRRRADQEEASLAAWRELWESRRFPDATVRCGERSFEVHRAVLGARSPVLNAMFSQEGLREGRERLLTVEDAEPETVETMLRYMYVGEVTGNCQYIDLLRLANQYEVDGLPQICADAILQGVSADTVVGSLCALRAHADSDPVAAAYERLLTSIQNDRELLRVVASAVRGPDCNSDSGLAP
mmetsp:Transcript_118392/g.315102  ORF Transcript_118392/g.315102 Transcript_118392/m.315102 type:complete len:257 (-) Transcript_118392:7-777(-)